MSRRHPSPQHPEIGSVALRLLTIPVMSIALVVCYLALRTSTDEPARIADASPALLRTPDESSVPPVAARPTRAELAPAAHDPAVVEHEWLDPTGSGRPHSP